MRGRCKPTVEGRKAEQALRRAVARVVQENLLLGLPIAVMKDGQAVLLPVAKALTAGRERRQLLPAKTPKDLNRRSPRGPKA